MGDSFIGKTDFLKNNMNHKDKIKLAKKMITPQEIKSKTPIFSSNAWLSRKESLASKERGRCKCV